MIYKKIGYSSEEADITYDCMSALVDGKIDYEKMRQQLESIKTVAEKLRMTVGIPFNSCKMADGNWKIVRRIINDLFAESSVMFCIYADKAKK